MEAVMLVCGRLFVIHGIPRVDVYAMNLIAMRKDAPGRLGDNTTHSSWLCRNSVVQRIVTRGRDNKQ